MKFVAIFLMLAVTSCAKLNQLLGPEGALVVERAAEGIAEAEENAFPQQKESSK